MTATVVSAWKRLISAERLAAGSAASRSQVVAVDGEPRKRVIIYMYPSMEAVLAWRNDPEYVKVRHVCEKYAKYHTFAVQGASP